MIRNSKHFATAATFLAYIALGLLIASLGASFIQLQHQTNSTPSQLTFVFTLRSFGYLIGSAAGGILLDKFPQSGTPVIAIALFVTSISSALIPFADTVVVLCILCCTQGIAMGTLDTVANVIIIYLWGSEAGPWMQGLHCSFAIGAVISPLVVRLSQSTSSTGTDITPAFFTFSIITALCGIYFLFVPTPKPPKPIKSIKSTETTETTETIEHLESTKSTLKTSSSSSSSICCSRHTRIILTTGALLGIYVGAETGFGGFVLLYSQKNYGMSEADGQYLNAVFFGFLTIGRVIGIPLSKTMLVTKQLMLDLFLSIIGVIVLVVGLTRGGVNDVQVNYMAVAVNNTNVTTAMGGGGITVATEIGKQGQLYLWIGSAVYGLGLGTIFPCAVLQAEEFTDLSGRAASVLMVGAAIGEMIVPLGIGLWTDVWCPGFVFGIGLTTLLFVGLAVLLIVQGRGGVNVSRKSQQMELSSI